MEIQPFIDLVNALRMTSAGLSTPAIIAVIFFLWRAGFFDKGKNGNGTPDWAKELKHHFNDEITEILKQIAKTTEKNSDTIEKHVYMEEGFQREVREGFRDIKDAIKECKK